MSKKLLSLMLTIAMVFAMIVPVFAADGDPAWSVAYEKSAKAVVITVDGVTEKFTNWKNNQAAEYEVEGYIFSVTVKGNAIDKKALVGPVKTEVDEAPATGDTNTPNPTPSNNQTVVDADTRVWHDGFGFHCNANGGNGATSVVNLRDGKTVKKGDQKNVFGTKNFPVTLERVGTTTLWNLMTTEIKCVTCGSTEWVTYSNNSGVINGKNIQAHHRSYALINKTWADENPNDEKAIFDIYMYDSKKADGKGDLVIEGALPGVKYQLKQGTYVVAERVKEGYKVQDDQRITVAEGDSTEVDFVNEPDVIVPQGSLSLQKTVDGVGLSDWEIVDDEISLFDIVEQITFYAYAVSEDGAGIPDGATPDSEGKLTIMGDITFIPVDLPIGWYAITEEFEEGSWAEKHFKAPIVQYFHISEKGITKGTVDWSDEDAVAEFSMMYAVDAVDAVVDEDRVEAAKTQGTNKNVDLRANVKNAYGAPDAIQNQTNGDEKFSGLGFFPEGVTYYFGVGDTKYDIYNNPDKAVADLSLIEVTWGDNWHTEAVDIYLIDATIDGEVAVEPTYVGRAFNKGKSVGVNQDGFGYEVNKVGNFTFTDIYLPNSITKAAAIRLVDATDEVNDPPTHTSWQVYDDGYDLDALVAYYTLPSDTFENKLDEESFIDYKGAVSFMKEVRDADGDTPAEVDEFKFSLDKIEADGTETQIIDPANGANEDGYFYTGGMGMVEASNLEVGSYVFREVGAVGYELYNYKSGFNFDIVGETDEPKVTVYYDEDGQQLEGLFEGSVINIKLGSLAIETKATLTTTTEEWKETFKREGTPYREVSEYSSVTVTNSANTPRIVPNSNHFTYAILTLEELENGVELDMVVGNKINKVGTAFVELVDGFIELTVVNDIHSSKFGMVALNELPTPSNGNVHSGNNDYGFKHNDVSVIPCPDVNLGDGLIYLYVHYESIQFNITDKDDPNYDSNNGWIVEWSEWVLEEENLYTSTDATAGIQVDVWITVTDTEGTATAYTVTTDTENSGLQISNLLPGNCNFEWTWTHTHEGVVPTFGSGVASVTVVAGEEAQFDVPTIELSKLVITNGDGGTFDTYDAGIDIGNETINDLVIR